MEKDSHRRDAGKAGARLTGEDVINMVQFSHRESFGPWKCVESGPDCAGKPRPVRRRHWPGGAARHRL